MCKQENPGGNEKDIESFVRMIFWLCGCYQGRWGGFFIGRDYLYAVDFTWKQFR